MIKKCNSTSGFIEVAHTADWAIRVWADDLNCLFEQAASGMYSLMEIKLVNEPVITESMRLESLDLESLLVKFLSELLYQMEEKRMAYENLSVQINGYQLIAQLEGRQISFQNKEIKAVTFHNLSIVHTEENYEVAIVFDV